MNIPSFETITRYVELDDVETLNQMFNQYPELSVNKLAVYNVAYHNNKSKILREFEISNTEKLQLFLQNQNVNYLQDILELEYLRLDLDLFTMLITDEGVGKTKLLESSNTIFRMINSLLLSCEPVDVFIHLTDIASNPQWVKRGLEYITIPSEQLYTEIVSYLYSYVRDSGSRAFILEVNIANPNKFLLSLANWGVIEQDALFDILNHAIYQSIITTLILKRFIDATGSSYDEFLLLVIDQIDSVDIKNRIIDEIFLFLTEKRRLIIIRELIKSYFGFKQEMDLVYYLPLVTFIPSIKNYILSKIGTRKSGAVRESLENLWNIRGYRYQTALALADLSEYLEPSSLEEFVVSKLNFILNTITKFYSANTIRAVADTVSEFMKVCVSKQISLERVYLTLSNRFNSVPVAIVARILEYFSDTIQKEFFRDHPDFAKRLLKEQDLPSLRVFSSLKSLDNRMFTRLRAEYLFAIVKAYVPDWVSFIQDLDLEELKDLTKLALENKRYSLFNDSWVIVANRLPKAEVSRWIRDLTHTITTTRRNVLGSIAESILCKTLVAYYSDDTLALARLLGLDPNVIISKDKIVRDTNVRFQQGKLHMPKASNYPINEIRFQNWVDLQCTEDAKKLADILYRCTEHVSWIQFYQTTIRAFERLIALVGQSTYCLFIREKMSNVSYLDKSNYWMIQLLFHHLIQNGHQLPACLLTTNQVSLISNLTFDYFVVLDDCVYSGGQMIDELVLSSNIPKSKIIIVSPYVSSFSLRVKGDSVSECTWIHQILLIDWWDIYQQHKGTSSIELSGQSLDFTNIEGRTHIYEFMVKHFPNSRPNLGYSDNNYMIYFDHKIADYLSSYTTVYQTGIITSGVDSGSKLQTVVYDDSRRQNRPCAGTVTYYPFVENCFNTTPIYSDIDKVMKDIPERLCVIPFYKQPYRTNLWTTRLKRIFVFDFDLTLTSSNDTFADSDIEEVFPHGNILKVILDVCKKNNIKVYIVSRNFASVIRVLMRSFYEKFDVQSSSQIIERNIIGRETDTPSGTVSTNIMWAQWKVSILQKIQKVNTASPSHIYFFDDTPENIQEARDAGFVNSMIINKKLNIIDTYRKVMKIV